MPAAYVITLVRKKKILHLFFLCLLFLPWQSFSQVSQEKIDPKNFKSDVLSELILNQINETRDSLDIGILEEESSLTKAAEQHAEYLKKIGKLTHKQKNRKFSTPAKRVKHFGGEFKAVAENIAFSSAGPTIIKGDSRRFTYNTYQKVATEIVEGWKKSPGHYKNIANGNMNKTGVAVSYNRNSNIIYAVQVFTETWKNGKRPVVKLLWFRF